MKVNDLKKNLIIIDWLQTINARPNTVDAYLQGLQEFTEYTGKDPEALLNEAESDMRSGKLMRERAVKRQIIGFRAMLQNRGYAPYTVKNRITGVKSFFLTNDIEIPKLPRIGTVKPLEKNLPIPKKDHLQELLKVADPLEKAIILVGAASGLAANEICNLRASDFKRGYDQVSGITSLELRRQKVNWDFVTFLSPEASQAVIDYLTWRDHTTTSSSMDKKRAREKQKIRSDNDYLFIRREISDEFLETFDENLRKLETRALAKIYQRLTEKVNLSTPVGDWGLIRSHTVRKWFNSTLYNAGCPSWNIEYWMGHTLPQTQAAYYRHSAEKLKEIYAKYMPYLTVQKSMNVTESAEFKKLISENELLAREAVKATVERAEIQDLKSEIEILKSSETVNFNMEMMKAALRDPKILEVIAAGIEKQRQ